jgi:hypothetical protein
MDALSYLIGRKWISGLKLGGLLALSTAVCWLNYQAALAVPKLFTSLFDNSAVALLWGFLVMAAGLLAIATYLGVTLLVPLYSFYRTATTLRAWIRQRVLEEMRGAGMTGRAIIDALMWFGARWWLTASGPAVLLSLAFFADLRQPWMAVALVGYLLCGAAALSLGLCLTVWSGFPGGAKATLPVVAALGLVGLVPGSVVFALRANAGSLVFGCLYVILVGRLLAIYGVENWESLSRLDNRARRLLRAKLGGHRKPSKLSENPIAARESMRGMDAGDLSFRLLMATGFVVTSVIAVSARGVWVFALFMVPVVLLNSYRGAVKMSQMVTAESEGATLETIRSTPISSDDFLKGWLASVVLPQWCDHLVLWLAALAVLLTMGEADHLASGLVPMGLCLSLILPLAGAYIGASIAGQAKTRSQISGQLLLAFGAVAAMGGPQMMAGAHIVSLPVSLALMVALTGAMCWVLDAGAKKSLNRVFLPQR